MNCTTAATSYPTDGKGSVTSTAANSLFVAPQGLSDRECLVTGVTIAPGTGATTVTVSAHDGSQTIVLGPYPASSSGFDVDLATRNTRFKGLKVVCVGTAGTAVVWFQPCGATGAI